MERGGFLGTVCIARCCRVTGQGVSSRSIRTRPSRRSIRLCRDASGKCMSACYKIDKERRLVLSAGAGVLLKEHLLGHMDRLSNDPDFDPDFGKVLDFTRINLVEVEPEDVRQLAQRNIFSPRSRRAFVVKDDLQFGLARMFEIHRELNGETGIRVFRTFEEAMNWIMVGETTS